MCMYACVFPCVNFFVCVSAERMSAYVNLRAQ